MSDFSPEGREEYPHLFFDEIQEAEFSSFPLSRLQELDAQYMHFIDNDGTFPPHRERAIKVHRHLLFELMWRSMQDVEDAPIE